MEGVTVVTLLAATEAPVWVAILLAVVTGLFGLLAGAAAAAVVTTSHERNERFRTRMMESAEQVVAEMDALLEILDRALNAAEGAGNHNLNHLERAECTLHGSAVLDEARPAQDALVRRLARLRLVHGDPRVHDQAREVGWMLAGYAQYIGHAISDFEQGRELERITGTLDIAEQKQKYSWMHRNRMLEVLHEEIFRYGTIAYWLRQRFGRLGARARNRPAEAGGPA